MVTCLIPQCLRAQEMISPKVSCIGQIDWNTKSRYFITCQKKFGLLSEQSGHWTNWFIYKLLCEINFNGFIENHYISTLLNNSRTCKFSPQNFLAYKSKFMQLFFILSRYTNELIKTVKLFINKYFLST